MIKPKLALIPSGYKGGDGEGTVYSILPNDASGDFDYERNGNATRVRKDGLIEELTVDDTPRLDWLNSNCPSLLLEPQRTNDTTYSQDFTQTSYWNNVIDVVATKDEAIAPDGTFTANKIQANSGTNFKILRKGAFTIPSGITMSMFVKRGNHDYIIFKAQGDYSFNLSTLTWGGSYSNVGYEDYGNGWIRLYATTTSSVLSYFGIYLTDSSFNQSWNATGNEFVYVWGGQYETGSYPTSYIKTEASTVTRLKDDCHLLNHTLFTDYPFTVYANAKVEDVGNTIFSIYGGASNKYLAFLLSSSTQVAVYRRDATNNDSDFYNFTYSIGDNIKVAVAFINDNTYKLYINGTEIADVTSGLSIPFDHDDILIGQFRISGDDGKRNSVDDFRVYDYTLTDAELTELTK